MWIIRHRKIWYILSGLLVAVSLSAVFFFGLRQGIEFTGGALLEVEYEGARPDIALIREKVNTLDLGNVVLQPSGEAGLIARMRNLSEEEHQAILASLSLGETPVKEIRFDSIGPVIGKELRRKSLIAIAVVVVMIILYISFAFRKVSQPVSSFKYGLMAITALIHDVTIPVGVFAALGKYLGVEIDMLFVTALLTILGFSVHDTIVVFDRVRENLKKSNTGENFESIVGKSVNQTIVRSINTSLTVLLVLFALFFLGGESTKYFSLALIIGVTVGTYSSMFLASPLLVTMEKWQNRKNNH